MLIGYASGVEIVWDYDETTDQAHRISKIDHPIARCRELPDWEIGTALPIGPGEHRRVDEELVSWGNDESFLDSEWINVTLQIKDSYGQVVNYPVRIPVPGKAELSELLGELDKHY